MHIRSTYFDVQFHCNWTKVYTYGKYTLEQQFDLTARQYRQLWRTGKLRFRDVTISRPRTIKH